MISIVALTCSLALAIAAGVQHHDSSIVEILEGLTLDQFCVQWSGACSSAVAEGETDSLCQAGFGTPVYPCTINLAEVACYGPGHESVKQEVFNDLGLEDYECVIPDAERTTALDV